MRDCTAAGSAARLTRQRSSICFEPSMPVIAQTGTRDGQQNPTGATAHLQHTAARRFRFVYVEADIRAGRVERHAVIEETEIGNRVVRRSH